MPNTYYNTTKEKGSELKKSNVKATSQEKVVLQMFKKYKKLSASQAWMIYKQDPKCLTPITSIRRAITNLTKWGLLVKTNIKNYGIYGKKEHVYRISYGGF